MFGVLGILFVTLGPSLGPFCLTLHLFREGKSLTLPLFLSKAQLGGDLLCPPKVRLIGPAHPAAPGTAPQERTLQISFLVISQSGIFGLLEMKLNFGRFQIENVLFHQIASFWIPYTSST